MLVLEFSTYSVHCSFVKVPASSIKECSYRSKNTSDVPDCIDMPSQPLAPQLVLPSGVPSSYTCKCHEAMQSVLESVLGK